MVPTDEGVCCCGPACYKSIPVKVMELNPCISLYEVIYKKWVYSIIETVSISNVSHVYILYEYAMHSIM